jgi:Protein of unknown function (DUF2974)
MSDNPKYELLLAILAMDSYNRGYGAGIDHGLDKIGTATFSQESDTDSASQEVATGFYAASYNLADGTTVISYRGTDASPDYTTGWVIALGDIAEGTQAPQALEFYNAVTNKTYADGAQSNVVLTGHSLGGLLAGYVAALSGTNARTFDHAPFALAAIALLPPIAGISGSMIAYIHKMGALMDSTKRLLKAAEWSTATTDMDRNKIESQSIKGAANDNFQRQLAGAA